MDEKFLKLREKDLLKQKKRLENELSQVARLSKGRYQTIFPDIGSKEDESAQEVEIYEGNLASEKNLAQLLKNINHALSKFKKGNFGVCEICGQEIEKERLIAYPEAAECLKCLKKKSR